MMCIAKTTVHVQRSLEQLSTKHTLLITLKMKQHNKTCFLVPTASPEFLKTVENKDNKNYVNQICTSFSSRSDVDKININIISPDD